MALYSIKGPESHGRCGLIDMVAFTPWSALIGGVLIGLSAAVLMLGSGRVAGVSGIFEAFLTWAAISFGVRILGRLGGWRLADGTNGVD